jgi:hypothetical protein
MIAYIFTFDIDWLSSEINQGYGKLSIPNSRDREITELIKQWLALDSNKRMDATNTISGLQRATLLAYSERMASRAVRESNRNWIVLGLIAQGLDGWRADWRENALLLCLHYDACLRLGIAANEVFSEAEDVLPLKAGRALASFLKRDPEDKSLDSMGYIASSDEDGFRYKRTW